MNADHARCEATIADLKDTIERMAASSLANAQRFAADLAAARGVTSRLRAAILAGATDAAQAEALAEAADVLESDVMPESVRQIAAALIACSEVLREARAEVTTLREQARAMAGSK